ncbi:MAG: DUF167 domain-containing protein [Anaerolineae bacterium]|nr:MAG: DUF167 domain-containing protein [Anaerolineae bacterium]
MSEPRLHNGKKGAALTVRVVPGSEKDGIVAVLKDGTLKVGVQAQGEAVNNALLAFLAELFEVPVTKFEIVAGASGVDKLISVLDVDVQTVQEKVFARLQ